jgi:hypothetical protein
MMDKAEKVTLDKTFGELQGNYHFLYEMNGFAVLERDSGWPKPCIHLDVPISSTHDEIIAACRRNLLAWQAWWALTPEKRTEIASAILVEK